jgi:hypothetical protein
MQRYVRLGRSLLVALLFAVLVPFTAHARQDGIDKGGSGCGGCHGNSATGSLVVSVSGPTTVLANATATYTLSVSTVNVGAGLSVDTDAGSLSVVDGNTKLLNGMITHVDMTVAAPTGNRGDWSYNFDLTAPGTIGTTITLAFSGLAASGNGAADKGGVDPWNVGTYTVTTVVPEPTTALLVSMGLGMLAVAGRRRKA